MKLLPAASFYPEDEISGSPNTNKEKVSKERSKQVDLV